VEAASASTAADVVRRCFELLSEGDIDGGLELFAPDAELHDVPEIPGSTVYRGRDGIRRWWETINESMAGIRFDFVGIVEGEEMIAVETRARATGKESGIETDWTFWTVWRVRKGLIAYHHGYSSREHALAALR
jgi:ketosteroid isomerase-like protein